MKAPVMLEIRPFSVPNSVWIVGQQGDAGLVSVPLSSLNTETLEMLCTEFRTAIFKAAARG